jgi:hypothetical protein
MNNLTIMSAVFFETLEGMHTITQRLRYNIFTSVYIHHTRIIKQILGIINIKPIS